MARLELSEDEVIDYRTETLSLADDEWTKHIISVSIDDDYNGGVDVDNIEVSKTEEGVVFTGADEKTLNYIVMAVLSADSFWKSDSVTETTVHNTLRRGGDRIDASV